MKKVYIGMSADMIHPGHLNIISEARKRGDVIIGRTAPSAISLLRCTAANSWFLSMYPA